MINKLSPQDIHSIEKLVKQTRGDYGIEPLGENLFRIVRNLNIHLIYVPIHEHSPNESAFKGVYLSTQFQKETNEKIQFIGVNSNDYFDSILFDLSHELYHYHEDVTLDIHRAGDEETEEIRELKANRFGAELLLPKEALLHEVKEWNNGNISIFDWERLKLLRFIAYVQCQYWMPYKCIVIRLFEESCISKEQHDILLAEQYREEKSTYYTIGCSVDKDVFIKLNSRSMKIGMEQTNMEVLLQNYENGILDSNELANDLALYEKTLDDYGITIPIDEKDLIELQQLFDDLAEESDE
ncbi:ImmA/IrrE family metallo-endopeptidase [Bacillus cereus]|nr:ImmA/IrrE family metallo-endopeptidase [Bacillus cereus]